MLLNLALSLFGLVMAVFLGRLVNKVRISSAILFASFFSWIALFAAGPSASGGIILPAANMPPFLFVSFVTYISSISEYFAVFATSVTSTLVIAASFWVSSLKQNT